MVRMYRKEATVEDISTKYSRTVNNEDNFKGVGENNQGLK